MAGLVTAAGAVATLLLLAPLMGLMPQATLAAVVIVYSIGLISRPSFSPSCGSGAWSSLGAGRLAGVVLLGTLKGILVAIIVSLVVAGLSGRDPPVYVLGRKPGTEVFRPRPDEHPEDETFPGLLIVRPEGRLFFANAQRIGEQAGPLIDAAAARGGDGLQRRARHRVLGAQDADRGRGAAARRGAELWLVALNPEVLGMVQRSPLGETLGRERMLFNLHRAVEALPRAAGAAGSDLPRQLVRAPGGAGSRPRATP